MKQTYYEKFHVEERIAFGAFSSVFLVTDTETKTKYALKVEKKSEGFNLLKYEAELGKSLRGLENVISIYDYFEDEETHGMLMEPLFNVLTGIRNIRRNPPSIPLLIKVARDCFNGVKMLHEKGILHYDLKPSNFGVRLTGNSYEIVVFDFGLSQSKDEPKEITEFRNNLKHNPRYFPIENHKENFVAQPWTEKSELITVVYTIADFWKGCLPWDGMTTSKLIFFEKRKHSLESLLPKELHFILRELDNGVDAIIAECDRQLATYERNPDEELHYLIDPRDPGYTKKVADLVFEKELNIKNQHSA